MNVLVLISNNLKYDTRVKNHAKTIAEVAEHVHILARPIPDDNFYLEAANITHTFFVWEPSVYPCTPKLREIAKELKIFDILWPTVPLLLEDEYYSPEVMEEARTLSDHLMQTGRWDEVLQGLAENVSDDQQVGWIVSFLDSVLQWAQKAVDIPADIVYCNDVDTLLCGVAHKKKYGSRLVYDAHDIACDMFPYGFPRQYRNFLARFEYAFIHHADCLIAPNESAVHWLKETYHCKIPGIAVSNCMHSDTNRIAIHDPHFPLRLYYHGFCDPSRGIDNMIRAIGLTQNTELLLRLLPSEYEKILHQLTKKLNLENRVRFLPTVLPENTVSSANRDGDVGIYASSVLPCINLKLALTNKFIEYLKAGLPVITVPSAEHTRIMEQYHAGYVIPDNSPESIAQAINKFTAVPGDYKKMASASLQAAREQFDAQTHRERLLYAVFNTDVENKTQQIIRPSLCPSVSIEEDYLSRELAAWQNAYLSKQEHYLSLVSQYRQLTTDVNELWQRLISMDREKKELEKNLLDNSQSAAAISDPLMKKGL